MKKEIFNRLIFIFVLYFLGLGGSVFMGQISCILYKYDDCPEGEERGKDGVCYENESEECDAGYEKDDGECVSSCGENETYDNASAACVPTDSTQTCQEYITEHFSAYTEVSGVTECMCVGADTSWCPQGDSSPASTYTTITGTSGALADLTSGHSAVAILLAEQTFDETLSLTNANYSNTYFIGIGDIVEDIPSDTIITYSNPTGVTDQVIEMDSNVNTIGFYNLTIDGIGTEVTASSTSDNLEAGTVVITNATSITFEDVTFTDNYFRGIYISGSSSTVTLNSVNLGSFITGATGSSYETAYGIWNEGDLTISSISISTDYVGIISTGSGNRLTLSNSTLDDSGVAEILLYDTATVDLTSVHLTNSIGTSIGLYGEDITTFTTTSLDINGPNYGFVGCQTNSSASAGVSNYTFTSSTDLNNLYFGTVTVDGSGNSGVVGTVKWDGTTVFSGDISSTGTHSKGCDVSEYY